MPKDALLKAALAYAEKGLPVFPCRLDKKPYTKHGFKDATTDPNQIKAWWQTKYPGASIGMPTGEPSNMWVLDMDMPDGPESLAALEAQYGELPDTLCQQTGGGGLQFFWKWEGKTTNNSGKLGPGLDVRGAGGYIIVPSSPHPSGEKYQWLKKLPVVPAPDWLKDLLKEPTYNDRPMPAGQATAYGLSALSQELALLASTSKGTRNDTLNRAAFNLGQLVAGEQLPFEQAESSLLGAAMGVGLAKREAQGTIKSGLHAGMDHPRAPEQDDWGIGHHRTKQDNTDNADKVAKNIAIRTGYGQNTDKVRTSTDKVRTSADNSADLSYSLRGAVKSWILLDKRQFRITDIYNDLGIKNRQQKKAVSDYLAQFVRDGLIERVTGQRGTYLYKDRELVSISFLSMDRDSDIESVVRLPLGLEELGIHLLPGNICVVAGESNAGKTALLLNIAHDNLESFGGAYPSIRYFSSEMGPRELYVRVKAFGEDLPKWQGLEAVERSSAFHQVLDPDGLNIIDYMEVHNEFYLVGEWIRQIHETLRDGTCIIALQKKQGAEYGRGGEFSLEKPRLYLNIMEHVKSFVSCKIIKAKNYSGERNPNGLEKDFRITRRGSQIEELTDWQFVNYQKRQAMKAGYEVQLKKEAAAWTEKSIPDTEAAFWFEVEGENHRLIWRDVRKWREEFPWLDVDGALMSIARQSQERPFLKAKSWFWQIKGQLESRNKKIMEQRGETL